MKNDILEKKEKHKITIHIGVIEFFMRLFREEYDNYENDKSLVGRIIYYLKELKSNDIGNGE